MKNIPLAAALITISILPAGADVIVATDAYSWHGDTITQGTYMATAPSPYEIISTYSAKPHYKFPIDKTWKLRNDISQYPQLSTPNILHQAIYNMGLDEMVNAIESDTTLRTGREWAGVWTRDISYSILLAMAQMQPTASKISLMKKVNQRGVIIQDTGSGGAWPVSSDREIWALAAFEVYKVTGEREWLEYIYPIIKRSLDEDNLTLATDDGLVKGETSFIDWREQSYPKWMQTADIYQSEALNTAIVHIQALRTLAEIANLLGHHEEAHPYLDKAQTIQQALNNELWIEEKGFYGMYKYGRRHLIVNPRSETLGESLAILYDIASPQQARSITASVPTTPFGTSIFFPQIADMPAYHNNALWPWVGAYWALACAKAGNEQGTAEAIGSVFRPAALFATNKENFDIDNGDIATELNSSNMLWCIAGNIAITQRILFGIHYTTDSLVFNPFVPQAFDAVRTLSNYKYRNATLDITVQGHGNRIASFTLNGLKHEPAIPSTLTGHNVIFIRMADNDIEQVGINHTTNIKAPLTPETRFDHDPASYDQNTPYMNVLRWNPIEYIGKYIILRDGERIAETRQTSYSTVIPGEYQVIGVSNDGIESFASQPRFNGRRIVKDLPGDTSMTSPEVAYLPTEELQGYEELGFTEVDKDTSPIYATVDIPDSGTYTVGVRYANGNGPVNTENKAAIRTISIDGIRRGVLVMPTRGVANWNDWGMSNYIQVTLTQGRHDIAIVFRDENNNMNIDTNHALIDCLVIDKIK